MRFARRVISSAARRVNVSSRMRSGGTPLQQQVRHPMGQRVGLAGAGPRDDQQRAGGHAAARCGVAVRDRLRLGGIQRGIRGRDGDRVHVGRNTVCIDSILARRTARVGIPLRWRAASSRVVLCLDPALGIGDS